MEAVEAFGIMIALIALIALVAAGTNLLVALVKARTEINSSRRKPGGRHRRE